MDARLEKRIDAYVDEVFEDVIADISELVSYPSVADSGAAAPGAPFGPEVRGALDRALGIAKRLGYETGEDEGFVGWADIPGTEDKQLATIAHLDVVPAGPGWESDPFTVVRREGWLIGRGVMDDKGPAVLSLYAGAFFKHEGITPRYSFRALLGCDEECGMSDVDHYLASHDEPDFLFTPDASFPLCNAEKGLYGAIVASAPIADGRILSWSGAEVTNAIPGESVAELACAKADLAAPVAHADRITVEEVGPGRVRITAKGIGGHASTPEGTLNAIGIVAGYLEENAGVLTEGERTFLGFLDKVMADTAGEALGVAATDDIYGALTVNGGTIEVKDGRIAQTLDIRYPASTTADEITARLIDTAAPFGAAVEMTRGIAPFLTSADHPAVQALLKVYRDVTGEDAEPFSIGGGTYARHFARAVSFGPEDPSLEMPSWAGPMHGPNEGASLERLKQALGIYIRALVAVMEVEL